MNLRPLTDRRPIFVISVLVLACALAACAWAIFTSGSVTDDEEPDSIAIPAAVVLVPPLDSIPVLVPDSITHDSTKASEGA
jgi:hypothetical protein